jgi:uncharacterized protein
VILYADASSLIKLCVQEPGSTEVAASVTGARLVATSVIGYVEVRAALARARRTGRLAAAQFQQAVGAFEEFWPSLAAVDVSTVVISAAASLAEKHGLRTIDAVHLASALLVQDRSREPVSLSAWDNDLVAAAAGEGLSTS